MSRLTLALGVALFAIEATVAIWILAASEEDATAWPAIALAVVAGGAFVASGFVALERRPENRTGAYLLAVGYMWFLGALSASSNDWVFSLGFLLGNLIWVPFTALVLGYPSGVLQTRLDRAIPVVTGVSLTATAFLALLVSPDPAQDHCETCGGSAISVVDRPGLGDAFNLLSSLIGIVLIVTVVVILVRRWRAASAASRRYLWPVLFSGAATLVSVGLVVIADQFSRTASDALQLLLFLSFASVPVSFLFGVLRTRLARSSVTDVVVALNAGVPIRDALAQALNDPTLELAFRLEESGQWIDTEGKRVPEPIAAKRRAVTVVERAGIPVAALVHDESLTEASQLVDAVAAAAGLSLRAERLQAELRAQYEMLRTITDTAPSLLVNLDTEARIRGLNRAAADAAGLADRDQARGSFFWDVFIDEDERDDVVERFEALRPTFPAGEYENVFTNARGETRVIAWRAAPVFGPDGEVESIVEGGIDVTERKQREAEIQASEERFRAVIEGAPVAIVEVGLDDLVKLWNPAAERIFGWSRDEVIGKPVPTVAPGREEEYRTILAELRQGHAHRDVETVGLRKDGTLVDVEVSTGPIRDGSGQVVGHMAVLSDISERKRHDEELRASRARIVAAGDDARRRLERDLHDGAQQRLVALSVSLRLAESRLPDDPSAAAATLAASREELAHALAELRELARGIHPAVLSDRGLVPALQALVDRAPLPVELETNVERLPAAIEAAAYFVVSESLVNVAKYAGASSARVGVHLDDGALTVTVSDDGVGGADPSGGSGLRGLADRVAALEGRLDVRSKPGAGTSIRADIPVRAAAPPA